MEKTRTILSVFLSVFVGLLLTMQVNAAEKTTVAQVLSINTHGKTADWLKAYKPLSARLNKLNPKSTAHVYESQFAGSGTGTINIVVESPSMAYIEQQRIKNQGDPEVAKLIPALMETGMTLESRSLLLDRAPDQSSNKNSPVEIVYAIDTHGKNGAYVEASKKLHERILKVVPDISVRMWETLFAGDNSGLIIIVVGFNSLTDIDQTDKKIQDDAETTRLFSERDKIGATILSRSLVTDVTPK